MSRQMQIKYYDVYVCPCVCVCKFIILYYLYCLLFCREELLHSCLDAHRTQIQGNWCERERKGEGVCACAREWERDRERERESTTRTPPFVSRFMYTVHAVHTVYRESSDNLCVCTTNSRGLCSLYVSIIVVVILHNRIILLKSYWLKSIIV